MKLMKTVLLAGMLAVSTGAAYAAEVPKFKDLDADGSKSLDEKEYAKVKEADVEKTFGELDKNQDGKLDVNEYSVIMDEDCE
jgi:hypothetical protein